MITQKVNSVRAGTIIATASLIGRDMEYGSVLLLRYPALQLFCAVNQGEEDRDKVNSSLLLEDQRF